MSGGECPGCGAYPGTFTPGEDGLCEGCEMELARELMGYDPDDPECAADLRWHADAAAGDIGDFEAWDDDLEDEEYRCPQCGECCDPNDVLAYGMCGACFDALVEAEDDAEAAERPKGGERP